MGLGAFKNADSGFRVMLYLGTLYNHFPLVCRFPITDKRPHLVIPAGPQEKVRATGSTWRGIPLLLRTHARTVQCRDSSGESQPAGHESASPRLRKDTPRPVRGRKDSHPTKSEHPPPTPRSGRPESGLCAPFSCRCIPETPRLAGH